MSSDSPLKPLKEFIQFSILTIQKIILLFYFISSLLYSIIPMTYVFKGHIMEHLFRFYKISDGMCSVKLVLEESVMEDVEFSYK